MGKGIQAALKSQLTVWSPLLLRPLHPRVDQLLPQAIFDMSVQFRYYSVSSMCQSPSKVLKTANSSEHLMHQNTVDGADLSFRKANRALCMLGDHIPLPERRIHGWLPSKVSTWRTALFRHRNFGVQYGSQTGRQSEVS